MRGGRLIQHGQSPALRLFFCLAAMLPAAASGAEYYHRAVLDRTLFHLALCYFPARKQRLEN
jgi:hypothetical protein